MQIKMNCECYHVSLYWRRLVVALRYRARHMSPASAIEVGTSGCTGEATVGSPSGAAVNGPS